MDIFAYGLLGTETIKTSWFAMVTIGIIAAYLAIAKLQITLIQRSTSMNQTSQPNPLSVRLYLGGAAIDAAASTAICFSLGYVGVFGRWNNDVMRLCFFMTAALFFIGRIGSRMLYGATLIEYVATKSKPTNESAYKALQADVAIGFITLLLLANNIYSNNRSRERYLQYSSCRNLGGQNCPL